MSQWGHPEGNTADTEARIEEKETIGISRMDVARAELRRKER